MSLESKIAVVTGVSRRHAIGAAIVRHLLGDGSKVFASGWPAHDAEMPWGPDADAPEGLIGELGGEGDCLAYQAIDLEPAGGAVELFDAATERFGSIDIVVAAHARSSQGRLDRVSAADLDRCWAVNARASFLLVQELYRRRDHGQGGRAVLFTSGQYQVPMPDEIAYAISKGAIHQMTASLADATAERRITVNCIDPGPVDTRYATGADHVEIESRFPAGRWGLPDDVARLVAWLVSDESAWVTGQVIRTDGGFRRH